MFVLEFFFIIYLKQEVYVTHNLQKTLQDMYYIKKKLIKINSNCRCSLFKNHYYRYIHSFSQPFTDSTAAIPKPSVKRKDNFSSYFNLMYFGLLQITQY